MKKRFVKALIAILIALFSLPVWGISQAEGQEIVLYSKANGVRVRESPSFSSPTRRFLLCGQAVRVTHRTTNGFYGLADGGYVHTSMLGDVSESQICFVPPKPFITATVNHTAILRMYPAITAPIAFVLPQSSTITLTARTTNGWYQAYYLGGYHYLSSTLLSMGASD